MNKLCLLMIACCAGLAVVNLGCGKKADANTELQNAENALAKGEAAQTAAQAPMPALEAQPSQPPPEAVAAPVPPPSQQMKQAMAAYHSGNLEDAVTRLQKLRATPVMAPEQRMAVQDAVAAVMTEIYARAAKGDARAIGAVKQYEMMQTAKH